MEVAEEIAESLKGEKTRAAAALRRGARELDLCPDASEQEVRLAAIGLGRDPANYGVPAPKKSWDGEGFSSG